MSEPIEVVTEFCAAFSQGREGLHRAIRQWFTPETVWINVGLATTTGIDEAIALAEQLEGSMDIASVRIEMLAIAATGNKVLTERIDAMVDAAGTVLSEDPVMGIFEVAGDRIIAWRDYFDSAGALARMEQG